LERTKKIFYCMKNTIEKKSYGGVAAGASVEKRMWRGGGGVRKQDGEESIGPNFDDVTRAE